jgi:hypothetical protein
MEMEMDKQFPIWMHLQVASLDNTRKIIGQMQKLFTNGSITRADFETDQRLSNKIKSIMFNSDDSIDYLGGGENERNNPFLVGGKKLSTATLLNYATSIRFYSEFLGYSHDLSDKVVVAFTYKSKYLSHSKISVKIQDNTESKLLLQRLRDTLCKRQTYINTRINRWLHLGNLAENEQSIQNFGFHELQPFIEMCLRFMFLPMMTGRLTRMRITLEDPIPDNLDTLYGDYATDIMYLKEGTKKYGDVMFLNGTHFTHVSLEFANNTGKKKVPGGKLVARDVNQSLSVYMYFFHKFCKKDVRLSLKHAEYMIKTSNLLFSGRQGGPWKHLKRDVRLYAQKLEIADKDLFDIGLGKDQNTNSYLQYSKIAWVAARSTFSSIGTDRISADTRAIQLAFGAASKFNSGLPTMRENQRARDRILLEKADIAYSNRVPQLIPIDQTHVLYPLLIEMDQKQNATHPILTIYTKKLPENMYDVEDNENLFTMEFKQEIGTTNVKTSRNTFKKKIRDLKPGVQTRAATAAATAKAKAKAEAALKAAEEDNVARENDEGDDDDDDDDNDDDDDDDDDDSS